MSSAMLVDWSTAVSFRRIISSKCMNLHQAFPSDVRFVPCGPCTPLLWRDSSSRWRTVDAGHWSDLGRSHDLGHSHWLLYSLPTCNDQCLPCVDYSLPFDSLSSSSPCLRTLSAVVALPCWHNLVCWLTPCVCVGPTVDSFSLLYLVAIINWTYSFLVKLYII